MPRSRSRSRERRRDRDRSRDRQKKRSRSRDRRRSRDKKSRSRDRSRSRGRDYKRRDRSRDKDSREKHHKKDRRSRDRSYDKSQDKRRRSSSSSETNSKNRSESSKSVKPIIITASKLTGRAKANRVAARRSSTDSTVDHRASFEISNEFSQEGFEQFSRDHGIDFTNIETDKDREALHEKMEQVLKEHFEAQGKVYPPPKPEKPAINAATGFANDGSFLEQFKRMQDEYKLQMEEEKRRKAIEDRLKSLPLRRRGGKILKTGIVAKTTLNADGQVTANSAANDAWTLYQKEVQKYKSASSCDTEAPTRPLVK
jgi:hypothetical protein